MKSSHSTFRRYAFTLVEVNLAILLVAIGLLSLFALFPLGLQESELSVVDTHEAQFAEHILSQLEANATRITDWNDWNSRFESMVVIGISPVNTTLSNKGINGGVDFPDSGGAVIGTRRIRYELMFDSNSLRVRSATLYVKSGRYGDFDANKKIYTTSFVFLGM